MLPYLSRTLSNLSGFKFLLRKPMSFDPWNALVDRSLHLATSHALFLYTKAASASTTPAAVLDRLEVLSIRLNKYLDHPEHEYLIVEAKDVLDNTTKLFVIHRIFHNTPTSDEGRSTPAPSTPTPSSSALSSLEEGLASGRHAFASDLPLKDAISLSAAASSEAVLNALDKAPKVDAVDEILGEGYILSGRYGRGQSAREVKPTNLKLFELLVLTTAVHELAPHYTSISNNCYWFANAVLDAVIKIFNIDNSPNGDEFSRPLDPHRSDISARFCGIRLTITDRAELSGITSLFKKKLEETLSEVRFFFEPIIPH
jgi:hypothetical protein